MGYMVMANAHKKVLSTFEVAKLMGLRTASIRRFAISGELVGRKLTERAWVFDEDDVAKFIRRRGRDIDGGKGGRPKSGGPEGE
jgi:hypothetical protein